MYLPEVSPTAYNEASSLYYVHSSFPGTSESVFFGPDTYLFLSFLRAATHHISKAPESIVDVCCGSGAGVIHMARTFPQAEGVGLDLNLQALELGNINAQSAGTKVDFRRSDLYSAIPDSFRSNGIDLIVANPPYIAASDTAARLPTYANGGSVYGLGISIKIVEEGITLLSADGVLIVYTAVAILKEKPGSDMWLERLQCLPEVSIKEYRIIHPDMWSEEIGRGAYAGVGRIQVVGAVLKRVKV